jgi:hypothetical protein
VLLPLPLLLQAYQLLPPLQHHQAENTCITLT